MGPRPRRAVRLTPLSRPDHAASPRPRAPGETAGTLIDPRPGAVTSPARKTSYEITIKTCRNMNAERDRLMRKQRGR
jgi:hypothetical protein